MTARTRQDAPAVRQIDVARAAGVSQATVSMVLGGTADLGRISPETQSLVRDTARRLHYTPKPSTSRARTSGVGPSSVSGPLLIGVHTFEPIFPTSVRDYYFEFLRGIEEQATIEKCNLMLFTAALDDDGVRRIYRGGVNGLAQAAGSILLGHHAHREDLARLADEGYPFVYVGRREVEGRTIAYVGGDYRSATAEIVDHLVAMGHRRFAYLGETIRDETQEDRWSGFTSALSRFGLHTPEPEFTDPQSLTATFLDEAVASGATVVLVESVALLRVLAAMTALRGIAVPGDLSVVLLVDDPADDLTGGPWATLDVPRNAMGRRAIRLLHSLLLEPEGEYDRQVLLTCTYTLTGSVGPPRDS